LAGLTISASTSFAHDFYSNVIHHGVDRKPGEEVLVARIAAFVVGGVSILIAIVLGPSFNVAFLVALAFAVAASANLPVILLSIFWKRFNTAGAVCGLAAGLVSSLLLILVSPSIMGIDGTGVVNAARHLIQANPLFPIENPGIASIPFGFLGAVVGTLAGGGPSSADKWLELEVRANTGLGSETAVGH
jgi:cation/acetate symporter